MKQERGYLNEKKMEMKRMARYFCDHLPCAVRIADLRYRSMLEEGIPGIEVSFGYHVRKLVRVYSIHIKDDEKLTEEAMGLAGEAVARVARKSVLANFRAYNVARKRALLKKP